MTTKTHEIATLPACDTRFGFPGCDRPPDMSEALLAAGCADGAATSVDDRGSAICLDRLINPPEPRFVTVKVKQELRDAVVSPLPHLHILFRLHQRELLVEQRLDLGEGRLRDESPSQPRITFLDSDLGKQFLATTGPQHLADFPTHAPLTVRSDHPSAATLPPRTDNAVAGRRRYPPSAPCPSPSCVITTDLA
jgi:hypothetical protein